MLSCKQYATPPLARTLCTLACASGRSHSKYFAAILLLSVTYASLSRYANRNMMNMSAAKMAVRKYSIPPAVSVNGLQEAANSEHGQPYNDEEGVLQMQ